MEVESAAVTHVGRVRAVNEDAFLALPELVLVADGMGGHACGDVASALTVQTFQSLAGRQRLSTSSIATALNEANAAILQEAALHPERAGLGTTVTGVAVVEQGASPHWLIFNVGDSRVYRLGERGVTQLTVDHSEVAELVAAGEIAPEQARVHPLRHVVTRSLGTTPPPLMDTWLIPVVDGDVFLICSDGLTNELEDDEIGRLVNGAPDNRSAAESLVEAAVAAGGRDNITVVMVRARFGPYETTTEAAVATIPRTQLNGASR